MIPKIIHQIWIGDKLLSDEHSKFVQMWREMYPDYTHVFWDHGQVEKERILPPDKHPYYQSDFYPIALKADLLRYEIIRKLGGVYIDVDTEPLKRWEDNILERKFFGGIQNNGEVAIGIFGAEPECPLIVDVCNEVVSNIEIQLKRNLPVVHVDQYTGPAFFDRMCESYKRQNEYTFFPPQYFYPYWITETHRRHEDFRVTCPDAYSVHHWTKNWI